jgi:hypothetical protein
MVEESTHSFLKRNKPLFTFVGYAYVRPSGVLTADPGRLRSRTEKEILNYCPS